MRITTSVVMAYIWFLAAGGLIDSIGLTEAMGVSSSVTAGQSFGEALEALNDISGGGISAQSLIGIYTIVTSTFEGFLLALTAGPRVLVNAGIPLEFVIFLHAPLGLLAGRELMYVLSGRSI